MDWIVLDQKIKRVIAVSDLHGDLHAFIVHLRDCAKVITKNFSLNPLLLDQDTETELEKDLNIHVKTYKADLNYHWIGGNAHVVICGDILDNVRRINNRQEQPMGYRTGAADSRCKGQICRTLEYDQIEVKLVRFINEINQQALKVGGRIWKILGNHELQNIVGDDKFIQQYAQSNFTQSLDKTYLDQISRVDYFKWGNPGYELLVAGGLYVCLMINNNIFVHGAMDPNTTASGYARINQLINNAKQKTTWLEIQQKSSQTVEERKYHEEEKNMLGCEAIKDQLTTFLQGLKTNICTSYPYNEVRIIVGHSPQSFFPENVVTSSMSARIAADSVMVEFSYPVTSLPVSEDGYFNGISMRCKTKTENLYVVYKVDCGTTRAFDFDQSNTFKIFDSVAKKFQEVSHKQYGDAYLNDTILKIRKDFGARTPQVLQILPRKTDYNSKDQDVISIIKSKLQNTLIHQPREHFELQQKKLSADLLTYFQADNKFQQSPVWR